MNHRLNRRGLGVLVGGLALAVASVAAADVPPPEGYVEQCTVERQQSAEALCESCGTYHGEPQKCVTQYASTAFQRRCRTAGASVWTEVWCRPRVATDPGGAGTAAAQPAQPVAAQPLAAQPVAAQPVAAQSASTPAAETRAETSDGCSVAAPGARTPWSVAWACAAAAVLIGASRRCAVRRKR